MAESMHAGGSPGKRGRTDRLQQLRAKVAADKCGPYPDR